MIKKINPRYRGFHVSQYNVLHDYTKLVFQYSCCWRVVNEFQSCCNLYFMVPFWREKFWKYSVRSNVCCQRLFKTFNGIIAQIGNAILFKNNYQLFRSYIPLQDGKGKIALRSLYIVKDKQKQAKSDMVTDHSYGRRLSLSINKKRKKKRKKIWIVTTHLTKTERNSNIDNNAIDEDKEDDDEIKKAEEEAMLVNNIGFNQINQVCKWMEDAQKKICKADAIIICGDFNATPNTKIYEFMINAGYKSVVKEKKTKEQWTFPTNTWKYDREGENAIYDEEKEKNKLITKDYIWIKEIDCNVRIEDVRLVGRQYRDDKHKGEKIQIYPSDHLGIYCKISI